VRSESGIYITGGLERAKRVTPALKRDLNCFDDARPKGLAPPTEVGGFHPEKQGTGYRVQKESGDRVIG
jgi:hypothetical protein